MTQTLERPARVRPDPASPVGDPLRSLPVALLAAATAWVSVLAWRGMAQDPGRISRPLVIAALLVALVGWAVRRTTGTAWSALLVQLVVLVVWLLHQVSGSWLPGPGSVSALANEIADGILASQKYYSPVSVTHPEYHFLITLGGVGIILAVDLLVCGLRQPALAGLPLLLVVTIAASVLIDPINVGVFVVTALGWLSLLVCREAGRLDVAAPPSFAQLAPVASTIAVLSVLAALVLTAGVTSEGRLLDQGPGGNGGNAGGLGLNNPLLDMRRNLRRDADIPLVRVSAPRDANPAYLRLTVLDDFTGEAWMPSNRSVADTRPVTGRLPFPVGLSRANAGATQTWQVQAFDDLRSTWLPLPTPTTSVDVGSRWRYDPDTLDVLASEGDASDLSYSLQTFRPRVDVAAARRSGTAPASIQRALTALPADLPPVFAQTARRVTAGADNSWDRAVALQDWFRSSGGFTYSTQPAPGNGIETLSRFITTDRTGYCEQFAAAMAVLARSLDIPARVSVGFLQPDQNGPTTYTFSSRDLHAWPELYFPGQGWTRFEPTPSVRTGPAPGYTAQQQNLPAPSRSPAVTATPTPSPTRPDQQPANTSGSSSFFSPAVVRVLSGLLAVLVIGGLLMAPRVVRRTRQERRWAGARDPRAVADTAWAEVRETARDLDLEWSDTSSVRVNGARVRDSVPQAEARQALQQVVTFVELTRYARSSDAGSGSVAGAEADRDRLRADVERWRAAAYDVADPRVARRARWWFPRR